MHERHRAEASGPGHRREPGQGRGLRVGTTLARAGALGLVLAGLMAAASPARGEDAAPAARPPAGAMIFNLLSVPVETQEQAFQQSLRRDIGPARRDADAGGPIKLGQATLTVTVVDPCPEADMMYHEVSLPRPLPGRTRR